MGTPDKVKALDDKPLVMVVGFLFSPDFQQVVLIRKTHPAWQAGKLNGLGGHVKEGEAPRDAMAREFKEESGLDVPAESWREYARLESVDPDGEKWMLHVFCATHPRCETVLSQTQEAVGVHRLGHALNKATSLANLSWLIPLAVDSLQSPFPCKVRARIKGEL